MSYRRRNFLRDDISIAGDIEMYVRDMKITSKSRDIKGKRIIVGRKSVPSIRRVRIKVVFRAIVKYNVVL